MNRTAKTYSFLDRFYKKFCCGAKNHPSSWKNDKNIANRQRRRKLKEELRKAKINES